MVILKFIYFNCACAKLIRTRESLNRPGATIPGTRMREELCPLVSQRLCVLASTDQKDACPFQICLLLHTRIVYPVMPSISCCCVVMFVYVPVFPCLFIESRVVCFADHCVSLPVFRCLGTMFQLWTVPLFCYRLRRGHHSGITTVIACGPIRQVSFLVPFLCP
jgi:hypothetical protein